MQPYITADNQIAGSKVVTVGTDSVIVSPARSGTMRRTQISISNNTLGANLRIAKGVMPASATNGIPLSTQYATYLEGDDGGYTCFQGDFHVYSDIAATVTVTETLEPRGV